MTDIKAFDWKEIKITKKDDLYYYYVNDELVMTYTKDLSREEK